MNELQQKQLALLNETLAHYNSTNRSVGAVQQECKYYSNDTTGCAIGRLIEDKELCKKLDNLVHSSVNDSEVWKLLPESVKQYEQSFLDSLQSLHDTDVFWNEFGVTSKGESMVNAMKEKFGLAPAE